MIAVVDYGVGNLFSLLSSLKFIGAEAVLTGDAERIGNADKIILPGVGAFGDAANKLRQKGLEDAITAAAKRSVPLLGICLGMQLLFERSEEYGVHKGLGLIKGEVKSLTDALGDGSAEKVPHIGWNGLVIAKESPLLQNVRAGECVYYVHSFYVPVSASAAAYSQYGDVQISGLVQSGNVFGTQFHPEKSGECGLNILRAFAQL